jgi:hypothetical protein
MYSASGGRSKIEGVEMPACPNCGRELGWRQTTESLIFFALVAPLLVVGGIVELALYAIHR